ncbi:hypothetical protein ALNOE001_00620 [Candidatus Methanobinarius endosymbioticus]|uniref:Uncharacterized protein n=1 Tax=Candidatus Methanobinarius endosymbioticus TaxID=2006182 RepID=A0A366MEN8_9EURY|nr:hypothetical protein ALNOE001_00620 [Candidatus Methanobinarius endosymbioticus]
MNKETKIKKQDNKKKKKEVLKLLGMIGIDTRYISYTHNLIYINDQRFAKFSKKRQEIFKKYYPEMDIISSTLLRKICIKFSEIIANEIAPKDNVLILKPKNRVDYLLKIVLEPYSRKYGINIIEYEFDTNDLSSLFSDNYSKSLKIELNKIEKKNDLRIINEEDKTMMINSVFTPLTLDEKVESILSSFFKGNGIPHEKQLNDKTKVVNPFINVSNDWIDSFLDNIPQKISSKVDILNKKKEKNILDDKNSHDSPDKDSIDIPDSFMDFIKDIIPQYKNNILKSSNFIEKELKKLNIDK